MSATGTMSMTSPSQTDLNLSSTQKRYSLVKWLENSQFDSQNEWLGRLTSVPHTNIIDFDADELKAGMEISVIRNNGEIWRAQVIIPKTASNTIDLPPSSYKKIRTKAMGTTSSSITKLNDLDSMIDAVATNNQMVQNEYDETRAAQTQQTIKQAGVIDMDTSTSTSNSNSSSAQFNNPHALLILTNAPQSTSNTGVSIENASKLISIDLNSSNVNGNSTNSTHNPNNNNNSNSNKQNKITNNLNGKEWQFLQSAINEAGLTDFYQTYTEITPTSSQTGGNSSLIRLNTVNSSSPTAGAISLLNGQQNQNQQQTILAVSDMNIETILQMQCELLDQQKELKTIELETMEQLKQLQQNIGKLSRKFESFEATLSNLNNNSSSTSSLKSAKTVFNKLNNTIGQQIKLVENEQMKEFCNQIGGTTTVSLLSPSQTLSAIPLNPSSTVTLTTIPADQFTKSTPPSLIPLNIQLIAAPAASASSSSLSKTNNQTTQASNATATAILLNASTSSPNAGKTHQQATSIVNLLASSSFPHSSTASFLSSTQSSSNINCINTEQKIKSEEKIQLDTNEADCSSNVNNVNMLNTSDGDVKTTNSISSEQKDDATTLPAKLTSTSHHTVTTKAQGIQTQIALNRFLRESVKQKLGADFLLTHAVSDIPINVMRSIKKEAFEKYLPHDRRPIKAWGLAMASLRCLKRDLVKNKSKQLAAENAIVKHQDNDEFQKQNDSDSTKKVITTRRTEINLAAASSLLSSNKATIANSKRFSLK